jgi:hypothetical protein
MRGGKWEQSRVVPKSEFRATGLPYGRWTSCPLACQILARKVFDGMAARKVKFKFWKFQIFIIIILNIESSSIFVGPKGGDLLAGKNGFGSGDCLEFKFWTKFE